MTLELFTNPHSRGQIAHWMMEEVGQPYETRWVKWGPEGNKSADFLAVNPMGKLPALRHDGKVVTEAAAICLYLADAFPDAGLKPGSEGLADYYRWMLFAAGPIEQAITTKAMGWEVSADRKSTLGFGDFEDAVGALEAMLKDRKFVCGDVFTAADVYVGSQVDWGMLFGTMPTRPAFEGYAERLRGRKAYKTCKDVNAAKVAEWGL